MSCAAIYVGAGTTRRPPARPDRRNGVTLVELLVVLVLLGVITAVALPNVERFYRSVTRSAERDGILDQFAGLGADAMRQGRGFVILGTDEPIERGTTTTAAPAFSFDPTPNLSPGRSPDAKATQEYGGLPVRELDIPAGWEIHLDTPLVVRASGVCLGGNLTLLPEDAPPIEVELVAPYCRVHEDAGDWTG